MGLKQLFLMNTTNYMNMNDLINEYRPLFSIVIPTYNREQVLLRAVRSVLNQTFKDFEIIVVDDGSTDNTKEVIASLNEKRLKYVLQKNQGATVARNTGIENAQGEYVSFLDSDDAWEPTMLEEQLRAYMADDEVGCVYTNVCVITSDGKKHPFSKPLGACDNSYKEILQQGYMAPTSVLSAKREVLVRVGMFDIELPASQDDDICFKLSKNCKVTFVPKVLGNMYVGQQNRISVNYDKVARGWWMLWQKYEKDIVENCGSGIMKEKYYDVVRRFALAKNYNSSQLAIRKYEDFGGHINFIDTLFLKLAFAVKSYRTNQVLRRVMLVYWKLRG